MASTEPPVLVSYASRTFQRFSGLSLSKELKGTIWLILSALSLKTTTRCKLLPFVVELHSYPIKVVNRPGSLYFSASDVFLSHSERVVAGVLRTPGSGLPFAAYSTTSR